SELGVRGLGVLLPAFVVGIAALEDRAAQAPPVVARRGELAELLFALGDVAERPDPLGLDVEGAAERDDGAGAVAAGAELTALREERLGVLVRSARGRRGEEQDSSKAERGAATGSHWDRSFSWAATSAPGAACSSWRAVTAPRS